MMKKKLDTNSDWILFLSTPFFKNIRSFILYRFAFKFCNLKKTKVDVNVGDEAASGSLGGLEPRVQWQTGGNVAGVDFTVSIHRAERLCSFLFLLIFIFIECLTLETNQINWILK